MNAPQSTHLSKIVAATRARLAQRKAAVCHEELQERAQRHRPRGFAAALRKQGVEGLAIIAELKKASPSRGLIRANFNPAALAYEMISAGAAALSVLTEEEFFQGSLKNLQAVSSAVDAPCLRKDFIVDAYQLTEARAYGADAVLLIAAALSDVEMADLREAARTLKLDVLCEVHDEKELSRVMELNCEMVGVNSRNLKTLEVDLQVAEQLGQMLPSDCVCVAESGIKAAEDLRRLRARGYDAFLIGESLMTQQDPAAALRSLLAAADGGA